MKVSQKQRLLSQIQLRAGVLSWTHTRFAQNSTYCRETTRDIIDDGEGSEDNGRCCDEKKIVQEIATHIGNGGSTVQLAERCIGRDEHVKVSSPLSTHEDIRGFHISYPEVRTSVSSIEATRVTSTQAFRLLLHGVSVARRAVCFDVSG